MIKPANELPKRITEREIIDYLEDYLMEIIEDYANKGYNETSLTGYSISVNPKTGELVRGLHNRDTSENLIWQWKSMRDYEKEVSIDFINAGYKIYDKNGNGCVWCSWA